LAQAICCSNLASYYFGNVPMAQTAHGRSLPYLCLWALTALHAPWGADAWKGATSSSIQLSDLSKSSASPQSHLQTAGQFLQQNPTSTSSKSWFQRLGDAFWSVLIAFIVVIPFSISLLWVNEKRNAQLESVLSLASSEVKTIDANTCKLTDYDGDLLHMNSAEAKGIDPVADDRFTDVKQKSGIVRLRSSVEVFQWEESENSETKKDSVGGGETTTKTYSYSQGWRSTIIDSSNFQESHGHKNSVRVKSLQAGLQEKVNRTVQYGEQHYLPNDLILHLNAWQDAAKILGGKITFGGNTFEPGSDGYHFFPKQNGAPQIGDFRVKVEYVPDGPASILALQVNDKEHEGCKSFLPYRAISRNFCGGESDEALKEKRLAAARKTEDDIYQESKSLDFGCFFCLCGCCNLITFAFSRFASTTPQVYSAWSGSLSSQECFDSVRSSGMLWKWGLRLAGWLLLWIGFNMLFAPLSVIADIIPFIGPYLGSGLSFVLGVATFLLTVALALFIVSCAYLTYHPLQGMLYMALTGAVVVGIMYASQAFAAKQ